MAKLSKLECIAIGSLPHKSLDSAMSVVQSCFPKIPFWPQMAKLNKNEDMIIQFTEGMPSFFIDENTQKSGFDTESDEFYDELEGFFMDYEEILGDTDSKCLNNYAISEEYSSTFSKLLDIIKATKPEFAKGQIVGPFTLTTTLTGNDGRCVIYDDTLKEIVIKTLALKALWQIKQIKKVSPKTTPIIFIDEPSISQLGTSAFITISAQEVKEMIKEISDLIKANGGMSAIHCCGKCDWSVPIDAGVNIINLDAYTFAQNLSIFYKKVQSFLENGGKIAWGVVPTLDKDALDNAELSFLIKKFETAVNYLTQKGIDEKLIIENSLVSPSCGAGGLTEDLALKAMTLTKELSQILKEKYSN